MADKPIYYSSSNKMPYGSNSSKGPMYYGGRSPAYYGRSPAYYGAGSHYGAYGAPAYGGSGGNEEGSVIGRLTVSRLLRVISQRWLSVFVFLLVGLVVALVVYRISPTIYEATSEFTVDMRRSIGSSSSRGADMTPDFGNTYTEIFNTRISDWRSEKVVTKIIQQYRANHTASTVSEDEIIATLNGSKLDLQRNSRIITITVRSRTPELASALANAYAEAIESFTDEENKIRCDKAVAQVHGNVEKRRREVDKISKNLLDFRTANKVDNLRSSRETTQQSLSKTTGDILALETEETQLVEWEKMLSAVQKNPENYGNLSTGVPRAQEIASEYRAFQDAQSEYQTLLVVYTDNHPEVVAKKKLLEITKQRFIDSATRALLTGRSMLQVTRNQLANLRAKQDELRTELASLEQRIVLAESGLSQLETERDVANRVLEGLIMDENQLRLEAEAHNEIVRVGRPATVPTKPVLPNPLIIFGAGVVLSIALGVLFVLVMDNLEDTIVNIADIEGRLALKVLIVLPHVRRKKREQVARFTVEDRYSQFSEAVASLRNLLDSPRYESMSHCMLIISTQPGEGKTITSTSLAITYAQTGKKTLLVDFDLRRPRGLAVWDLKLDKERSFSHVLQEANDKGTTPDFSKLTSSVNVPSLDVIASLPPEGITPSTILGSRVVSEFFDWARANYERVIVDSPPYGLVGDVVSLAMLVDSCIIMCCPDRTHFKPIQYCARSLTEAGANILGVVVNDIQVSSVSAFTPQHHHHGGYSYSKGYGYGYGNGNAYGYGYGYGYGDAGKKRRAHASAQSAEGETKSAADLNPQEPDSKGLSDDE